MISVEVSISSQSYPFHDFTAVNTSVNTSQALLANQIADLESQRFQYRPVFSQDVIDLVMLPLVTDRLCLECWSVDG